MTHHKNLGLVKGRVGIFHSSRKSCGITRRSLLRTLPTASLAAVAAGGVFTALVTGCDTKGRSFQVKGGETNPVMPSSRYRDPKVRMIYSLAREHRGVLDKLYCYCYCDRPPFNHKSLLSCYTNDHGAG